MKASKQKWKQSGDYLRKQMREVGMDIKGLAEIAGVSLQFAYRMVRGEVATPPRCAVLLSAKHCGRTADFLAAKLVDISHELWTEIYEEQKEQSANQG